MNAGIEKTVTNLSCTRLIYFTCMIYENMFAEGVTNILVELSGELCRQIDCRILQ